MKHKINPNGPAMPRASEGTTGLSIRAELAARAMQGLLSGDNKVLSLKAIARYAVECADELIKKLNENEKVL